MTIREMLHFEPWISVWVFLIGLSIGSFVNVCIYRLPLGKSVVKPRSGCPSCGAAILWYHNIPVLSWIFLGGRCAACRTRISVRYPFVELLCGAAVLGLWIWHGPSAAFAISAPFALAMIILFFTDWDHHLLPDAITLTGVAAGLALAWFNPFLPGAGWERVWSSLAGAALGSGALWSVGAIYGRLRGVEAMGMGDVKMMGMVGAFSGIWGVLFTIFAGSLGGALVGLALIPLRGRNLQDTLPFGCFLAPAALTALLVGRQAVAAYIAWALPPTPGI